MSSQDRGGRPDYPPSGGEAAEGLDILEQGRDRPPTRWRPRVRGRQPSAVAIILGVTGLLVGLAAGYAAGTRHAEKATAPAAQSSATASPTPISQFVIGGTPGQFQLLRCSGADGTTCTFRRLDTPVTNLSTPAANGTVIMILPPAGGSS